MRSPHPAASRLNVRQQERTEIIRQERDQVREAGETARIAGEEARAAAEAARQAAMDAVRATAETLQATLGHMEVVETLRRTLHGLPDAGKLNPS